MFQGLHRDIKKGFAGLHGYGFYNILIISVLHKILTDETICLHYHRFHTDN